MLPEWPEGRRTATQLHLYGAGDLREFLTIGGLHHQRISETFLVADNFDMGSHVATSLHLLRSPQMASPPSHVIHGRKEHIQRL